MSVMIDMIGAAVLLGIVMLTILSMNVNFTAETYRSMSTLSVESEAMQLARILEFDVYKMGYGVPKPALLIADSSRLQFRANLRNVVGGNDLLEYVLGSTNANSTNPQDKSIARFENNGRVFISYSATRFRIMYYDRRDSLLSPLPLSAALRDSVRSIKVILSMESPEPFTSAYHTDSTYSGAYYEKLIHPRNLQ